MYSKQRFLKFFSSVSHSTQQTGHPFHSCLVTTKETVVFAKCEAVLKLPKQLNYEQFFIQSRGRTTSLEVTNVDAYLEAAGAACYCQNKIKSSHLD